MPPSYRYNAFGLHNPNAERYSAALKESARREFDVVKVGQTWRNNQSGHEFVVDALLENARGTIEKAKCKRAGGGWMTMSIGIERFGTAYTLVPDSKG